MKKKPGEGYATSGVGSNQHFLGEWFIKEAGHQDGSTCPTRARARR